MCFAKCLGFVVYAQPEVRINVMPQVFGKQNKSSGDVVFGTNKIEVSPDFPDGSVEKTDE